MKRFVKKCIQLLFGSKKYKIPYLLSYFKYLSRHKFFAREEIYDLTFVIPDYAKGWILEAICKEIQRYYKGRTYFASNLNNLPLSKAYFFSHYSLFPICLKTNPCLFGKKTLLFHSHPKDIGLAPGEFNYVFKKATKLICMNSFFAKLLVEQGLPKKKVTYELCGADPNMFLPHERKDGNVGLSTAFYERKNPERILNIIKKMPYKKFILLGKNWDKYPDYNELIKLQNLIYVDNLRYLDYPKWYSKMDVFVSPAVLEGGPISLIESMMCNVVPVASKTGFSRDIINDKENGFLFDVDSSDENIIQLINEAYNLKCDIRNSVKHLTWERYSKSVQSYLQNNL